MKIPKLRFKEFSGEWEEKRLGDIADIKGGKRLPKGSTLISKKNNFPYITVSDFENKSVNLKNIKYVPIEIVEKIKKYRIYTDEIYISVAGTLGLVGKIPQELNGANLTENADKLTNIKTNQDYLLHYLCTNTIQEEIEREKTNNAQPKLALAKIKEFKIQVPCLKEQEKIGNFLSTVDKKISLTEEKLNLFKEYKKGMMQKIFNQELRVKDENGQDYPDWVEKRLGDIATFSKGKALSKEDLSDTGIECIRYGELYTHYTEVIDKIKSKTNLNKDELVLSEENDIIIPSSGETALDIAKASCVLKSGVALGGDLNIIKVKESGVFLSYYLNNKLKKNIASLAQGASIIHLYENHLKLLKINLPCIEEQEKIAKFLSSIDNKIENLSSNLENLRDFKKGLLQKMFI